MDRKQILKEHEQRYGHSRERTVIQDVGDREVMTCHECEGPIARNEGDGWIPE